MHALIVFNWGHKLCAVVDRHNRLDSNFLTHVCVIFTEAGRQVHQAGAVTRGNKVGGNDVERLGARNILIVDEVVEDRSVRAADEV